MTDNEIIKALEHCARPIHCGDCPYTAHNPCRGELITDAFNLVNRQKAEIDRLSIELQAMRSSANSYKMHYENAQSICRGEAVDIVDHLIETLINSNGGAYSLLLMKLRNILTAMWIVGDIEIDNEIENKHATQKASEEA